VCDGTRNSKFYGLLLLILHGWILRVRNGVHFPNVMVFDLLVVTHFSGTATCMYEYRMASGYRCSGVQPTPEDDAHLRTCNRVPSI
jgi:hypothetical protein